MFIRKVSYGYFIRNCLKSSILRFKTISILLCAHIEHNLSNYDLPITFWTFVRSSRTQETYEQNCPIFDSDIIYYCGQFNNFSVLYLFVEKTFLVLSCMSEVCFGDIIRPKRLYSIFSHLRHYNCGNLVDLSHSLAAFWSENVWWERRYLLVVNCCILSPSTCTYTVQCTFDNYLQFTYVYSIHRYGISCE